MTRRLLGPIEPVDLALPVFDLPDLSDPAWWPDPPLTMDPPAPLPRLILPPNLSGRTP